MKILTIGIVLFLFACNAERTTEPVPADTYNIAYNVLHDAETDDYEIFVMNTDGSGKKNISNWKGVDWVYDAHDDKLFFISDRDTCYRCYFLYEMDADGNNVRKISDLRLQDCWITSRKNGTELIINPRLDGREIFYIIDRSGNLLDSIAPPFAYINDPVFSPDGQQIVFRAAKDRPSKDRTDLDELYRINADGSGLQQLTNYPKADTTANWHDYHAGPPRWNTAQNIITYQSKLQGKYRLYAINPDGSGFRKLMNNNGLNEGWHHWSPDGNWLAIEMFDDEQTVFDIYLLNWQSQEMTRLTDSDTFAQAPVFVKPAKM